jgi:predicted acylesterase/phospholipase RssA
MGTKVRFALTLSGAVSLGAFEGGVLAALLNGIRPLCQGDDPDVRIDAVGGASAGAMTALLATRCLTGGLDPVALLQEAWVAGDSIQQLLHNTGDSPLSAEQLQRLATRLFRDDAPTVEGHQAVPVKLVMMLACLRGLGYRAQQPNSSPVDATTYVDLISFDIDATWNGRRYLEPEGSSPAGFAIASGANEFGFPPQVIDRSSARSDYETAGLTLPDSGYLWYTDGGTLDNEPLGHTLDLTNTIDQDFPDGTRRVHLLIHPDPSGAPTGNDWADPNSQPSWVATLSRASHLQRTQSLFDDLRTVVKTSTRIRWLDDVIGALTDVVADLPTSDQEAVARALTETLTRIRSDQAAFPGVHGPPALPSDAASVLDLAIRTAAGVSGKQAVGVEVISPLQLSQSLGVPVSNLLAGEVLGHFGGFFDDNLRKSDFNLGYQCALLWMEGGLPRCGLDPPECDQVRQAASESYDAVELWREWGQTSLGSIAAHHPLALAGLLAQVARVSVRDLLHLHHSDNPHRRP